MKADAILPYAPVLIKLLQGVLYHDDVHWNLLLREFNGVQDYFAKMGMEVYLKEADGYAYLRQPELEAEDGQRVALPRLTRRDRLSYHVTLICVILRERLYAFESSNPDADRLILTETDIIEAARVFYRERGDERTLRRKMTGYIKQVVDLGFLKALPARESRDETRYEVRAILRSKLDSEKLAEIKSKLADDAPEENQS